jgi:hypothetical protein
MIGTLLYASINIAFGQSAIRQVDFKNFSYPWRIYSEWPDHLEWLDTSEQETILLADGKWSDAKNGDASRTFSGLTFESTTFSDVAGSGETNAIVVLRYDTGGTQYSHYVYIYTYTSGKPKLLAYFHSGDRAASGLYRVYGQSGKLVVELFDPNERSGDCCSSRFVRTRYKWHNGRFEADGPQESGRPKAPSRLPVSVFGTHQ